MNFVKREDRNDINEENLKVQMESLQKSQLEADYQHTPISMEQIHQVMQSSLNASSLVHNFQLPLSPRQMSTLMLKTNHLSRHINFNDIPAHLPRNLVTELELVHNLANENLRHDDMMRNLDINLARSLNNDLELQNSLTQSLVQNLSDQDLHRNLNGELNTSLVRSNEALPTNLGRTANIGHELPHELDLSLHMNRQNIDTDLLSQDESRRTPIVMQAISDNHLLEQNLTQRIEQTLVQRLEQNLAQRLDINIAQRLEQNLAQRLDQNIVQRIEQNLAQRLDVDLAQRLDQRLAGSGLNLLEPNTRVISQDEHMLPMPFQIKAEQEDDGYFYENINQGLNNVNGINGHLEVNSEHNQPSPATVHQNHQNMFSEYNNHISNLSGLNVDLYSRQHNYLQNYANTRDNPQNLVVHRQFENDSPYPDKVRQENVQNEAKDNVPAGPKIEEPKENLKPSDNKIYYGHYDLPYANHGVKNSENDSSAPNKLYISDELSMNIKGEYICYKCNDIFPSKRGLKQHAKSCIENAEINESMERIGKFSCTQCAYRCQSPAILKIHERVHSGEKPFSCTFCDYKSGQKNNVAKHILVHMKEKPFRCQYCEYRCAQKNNLVVHERTHTGYKPFACPSCDYRTVQKPNLVKHMYLHTDQKPFSCDICNYRCVQKTNLTKHKQRHFNEKNGEKIDMKNQNKPYRPRQKSVKCPHCPYRCVQKSSLDKHLQFKHGEVSIGDYNEENYDQGLNLMKSDHQNSEETVHNLSVKKDEQLFSDMCQEKVMESLQIQS